MTETYDYSRAKMQAKTRKRRLAEIAMVIPGVLFFIFFAGLYVGNPVAKQVAETLVEHWNWVVLGAMFLVVFGPLGKSDETSN